MTKFLTAHQDLLTAALKALHSRGFWSPYSEVPSGKIYGETAKADGEAAFNALIGENFDIPRHPQSSQLGNEASPFGQVLDIRYPAASAEQLIAASSLASEAFANSTVEARVGACLEILHRLNKLSFTMVHATMHTTGQAFAMAFQAGGPHAQDRGLEAVVMAYDEMTRFAQSAIWSKPQGKAAPIVMEKQWSLRPQGIALTIGCNTFPTWNSYPGIFASLATGNPVIVKPHPSAILPLAITVKVAREVFAEAGLPEDAVLLAVDEQGAEITKRLAVDPAVKLIDYTGSSNFGDWLRKNCDQAQLFSEETGVNSVVIAGSDDFDGMCANLAFSLSLYSGQMCTSPQNIYVPKDGIETNLGHKSFDDVAQGITSAIDALLSDPARAAGICGAIANPATLKRVVALKTNSNILRQSEALGSERVVTPLVIALTEDDDAASRESFGPISFMIASESADSAIQSAAQLALNQGAITAAIYDNDEARIERAINAFTKAGVNLSINLTGNIFVNQSAAFSDFHVTGANPAGSASLTDTAFVASRFRRVMSRRIIRQEAA
jgi:phenylacetic acid degradation protein paaN